MDTKINKCGCGNRAKMLDRFCVTECSSYSLYSLRCGNCFTTSSEYTSEEQAIEAWNTAHPKHEPMQKKQYLDFLQSLLETSNISQYAFDTLSTFDYPIFELPKLSNQVQAVQWLEKGDIIINNRGCKYKWENDRILMFCEGGDFNPVWADSHLPAALLMSYDWQLYEEPKYTEITAEEALTDFALHGVNRCITFIHENVEYYIFAISLEYIKIRNFDITKHKTLTRVELQGTQWRKYEN